MNKKIIIWTICVLAISWSVWGFIHFPHRQPVEQMVTRPDTQDQTILDLRQRVAQLQQDRQALLNWFCIDIQKYSDGQEQVINEDNKNHLERPGRCNDLYAAPVVN